MNNKKKDGNKRPPIPTNKIFKNEIESEIEESKIPNENLYYTTEAERSNRKLIDKNIGLKPSFTLLSQSTPNNEYDKIIKIEKRPH